MALSLPTNIDPAQAKALAEQAAIQAKKKYEDSKDKLDKAKSTANKARREFNKAKDAKGFLKSQNSLSSADVKNILAAAAIPILMKFINAEKVANYLIEKLTREVKKKLSKYGTVEVVDGTIIFTPRDKNSAFTKTVRNFKRQVDSIKKVISTIKTIIDTLVTLLKIIRAGLVALKLYIVLLKVKLKKLEIKAAAEAALPTESKPALAEYIAFKAKVDPIINVLEKKVDDYLLMATVISGILGIFKKMIDKLKEKLDKFNIIINELPDYSAIVEPEYTAPTTTESANLEEDYEDMNGKQYTIKTITLPNGLLQVTAYDKISNLPVTKTAPSKTRGADQLVDEIKQILG